MMRSYRTLFSLVLSTLFILWLPLRADGQIKGYDTEYGSSKTTSDEAVIRATIKSSTITGNIAGSVYIRDTWKNADIIMNGSDVVITGIPVKIDAHHQILEIIHDGKIKMLPSSRVKSVVIGSERTTYITEVLLGTRNPKGFYRLIYNHHTSLLCHYHSKIRPSSYNLTLDMGQRDDAVEILKDYYLLYKGELIRLEGNRRKLARQFDSKDKIHDYILSQKIRPRNEFDLMKLAIFCDSLKETT